MAAAVVSAALSLAGCTATADSAQVHATEFEDAGGQPCPEELPVGDDPSGHGFGVQESADEIPNLLAPQEAWVCQYNPVDAGSTANGGTISKWERSGEPAPVAAGDIDRLQAALGDLAPADPNRGCTADLGPRGLVAYTHDGDLTGVVVDDYGCRDVRLTERPHTTPPGADGQEGEVRGVLDGGRAVLAALGVGRGT